jgi:hypothetical protein
MRFLGSVWFMIGTGSVNTMVHEVLRLSVVHDWYRDTRVHEVLKGTWQ